MGEIGEGRPKQVQAAGPGAASHRRLADDLLVEESEDWSCVPQRAPLQEPKVEESGYILMRRGGMASRARCPLQGPQLEGDWRRWKRGE